MYIIINDILVNFIVSMSFLLAGLFLWYRNSFNEQEKVFGYFLVLNVVFETIAWSSLTIFRVENNLPGLHLYTLLEFIFILWFCNRSIPALKGITERIALIGTVFIFDNTLDRQSIFTYNSISISAVKIFTITMSILFFYRVLATQKYSIIEIRPSVYFFTGLFLNSCTSMTWYMYSNKMLKLSRDSNVQLDIVKNSTAILASLIILTGILYIIKRKDSDII